MLYLYRKTYSGRYQEGSLWNRFYQSASTIVRPFVILGLIFLGGLIVLALAAIVLFFIGLSLLIDWVRFPRHTLIRRNQRAEKNVIEGEFEVIRSHEKKD